MAIPVGTAYGSTGHPTIGTVTAQATLAGYTAAAAYVNVTAGSATAGLDCGATFFASCTGGVSGFFAINFNGLVTFSGSQFALYLSRDGLSQVSAGDIPYAGGLSDNAPFTTAALGAAAVSSVIEKNGTFYLGNTGLLSGPIPSAVANNYKYIKIFDGSTTALAVSAQYITIMPGLTVKPTSGSAGESLVFTGGGFPSSKTVDILYQFAYVDWEGNPHTSTIANLTTGISTGSGYFSVTAAAPDTKQVVNPLVAGPQNVVTVNFMAKLEPKPHTLFATTSFNEWPRFISSVFSYDNTGAIIADAPFSSTTFYGNDTGTTGAAVINGVTGTVANIPTLDANVLGSLGVSGNFSLANAAVTVWIGATQIGTANADSKGNFVVNSTIPVLPKGTATVLVKSNGVSYQFTINVLPTLILTPNKGPVGTTVTATAYGFPSNTWVSLWWNEYAYGDGNDHYLVNGTVSASGSFNVTMTFVVPHSYGGTHFIDTTSTDITSGASVTRATITGSGGFVTTGSFKITPTLVVTPSSSANDGGVLTLVGTGIQFYNTYAGEHVVFAITIDNQQYAAISPLFNGFDASSIAANATGDLSVTFYAAGFRPGLHVVSLAQQLGPYCDGTTCDDTTTPTAGGGSYTPYAHAFFNITTAGDPIFNAVNGISASVTSAVNSALGGFSTQLTSIQTSLTSIQSSLTTVTSDVSGLGSQLTAINTAITNLGTQLTSVSNSLSSITSTLNQVATSASNAATQAQAAATSANNAVSGNSTSQTYVLVVAVLAAITLVLELAILVRKLS